MTDWLANIGAQVRVGLANLGLQMRTFAAMLRASGGLVQRFRLVSDQIHFIGNYSLVIIAVSGLFVGFVLGLQGYYTLNKYGSEQALGLLVALSLVRELGPVVTSVGTALLGWRDCHAAVGGGVLSGRCAGRLCCGRAADRGR